MKTTFNFHIWYTYLGTTRSGSLTLEATENTKEARLERMAKFMLENHNMIIDAYMNHDNQVIDLEKPNIVKVEKGDLIPTFYQHDSFQSKSGSVFN